MDRLNHLRILVVVNLPWDSRLGAARVWMELAEQWRAMGHTVEKFTLSDAFPGVRATRVTFGLRQLLFIRKAARFVRTNAHRFDFIDALIGTLPYSKDELGFRGTIVARSVGLYRFYERFEQHAAERWPRPARGKFVGRLLSRFIRRRLTAAAETAIRKADLINVPNEDEAAYLRRELGPGARVLVQPYGLTEERRDALPAAAGSAALRLAQKRVCFIGMWSPRKGSHDWAAIIRRVRERVPEARFRFLGTMVEPATIRADLPETALEGVDFISAYQPSELPQLLADCTVAAFPSYVEGFGLAVLEQLAAGLPTVAYDTAGPRDILQGQLPELLVARGETARFAEALTRVLQAEPREYEEVSQRARKAGAQFSWREIARDTLEQYRPGREAQVRPIVFMQPFSLRWAGGGARIMRALLEKSPARPLVVCTSPQPPQDPHERHLPTRPFFGRIENSRLAGLPELFTPIFRPLFRRRLEALCRKQKALALHAIPHAHLDFLDACHVATQLQIPFFLQVHDDFVHGAKGRVPAQAAREGLLEAWQKAHLRFVVSPQLGEEYCRLYGRRDYIIVTDGVEQLAEVRVAPPVEQLNIYFMGLFHLSYEENLRGLLRAIAQLPARVSVTLRCGQLHARDLRASERIRVLPFGSENDVQRDLAEADLLYLPLPFAPEFEPFVRLSLSTKLVTYLGSGIPILYHGPREAAAHSLLAQHEAAFFETTLAADSLAGTLRAIMDDSARGRSVAQNALRLAKNEFTLEQQRRKFWGAIAPFITA